LNGIIFRISLGKADSARGSHSGEASNFLSSLVGLAVVPQRDPQLIELVVLLLQTPLRG